ncbi:MAG: ECF-type sigma factor [Pirellulaceae bacterium]|jgi:RNA polymerase sigma factor (TIGR02999 family)|nr:ECF-type sigma factor [Pirellulaceae bacterium]
MAIDPADDVTRLLGEIASGNEAAKNELFECVYEELHTMAERHMKQERPGHTLGATGLVHEVYLRLKGQALQKNRPYFFAAAAKAMYRILVERARQSNKHHRDRIPLDVVLDELEIAHRVKMLDLHEYLKKLKEYGERGKRQHEVLVQRFFGGLQWKEIATNLNVSVATVEKDWQAARAWLYARLKEGSSNDG